MLLTSTQASDLLSSIHLALFSILHPLAVCRNAVALSVRPHPLSLDPFATRVVQVAYQTPQNRLFVAAMPVELRKRKAPAAPPPEPPAKKKQSKVAKVAEKVKEAVKPRGRPPKAAPAPAEEAPAAAATNGVTGKPQVGDIISLDSFGGEVETNDGVKTSLKALVDESKAGVVLFTYPKASTPGCKCCTENRHHLTFWRQRHHPFHPNSSQLIPHHINRIPPYPL